MLTSTTRRGDQLGSEHVETRNGRRTTARVESIVFRLLTGSLLVAASGCGLFGVVAPEIQGSGRLGSRVVELQDVQHVVHAIAGEIVVETGDQDRLEIEADDNVLPWIQVNVSSRTVEVRPLDGARLDTRTPIRCRLVLRDIRGLHVAGPGTIRAPAIDTHRLELDVSGPGQLIVGGRLVGDTLQARVTGSGSIRCELRGMVGLQDVELAGSGVYEARNLESEIVRALVRGSGSGFVRVRDELDVTITGSGSVNYVGQPQVSQAISGSGSVRCFSS